MKARKTLMSLCLLLALPLAAQQKIMFPRYG